MKKNKKQRLLSAILLLLAAAFLLVSCAGTNDPAETTDSGDGTTYRLSSVLRTLTMQKRMEREKTSTYIGYRMPRW